jgi:hypothetical protein
MVQIIPSLGKQVLSRMTSGEKRLAYRFKSFLEDDYLCWYDIPIGRKNRYPDYILLHPSRGMLFLEVKDWHINSIKKINKTDVDLLTSSGLKVVANPIEQCRQCAYIALKLFEKDPLLKEPEGKHKGKFKFPYGWGVVMSNITRKQWDAAVPQDVQEIVLPPHLIIFKDEMTESVDAEAFQERLWNMFNYNFNRLLTKPEIDRIRWHLFPEIRVDVPIQQDLLALNSQEDQASVPDIVNVMDLQQEQLARNLGEGHRVIHGVAGSGKTLILGFRALHLCETAEKPILILCFNVSLAAKLRSYIIKKAKTSKVQVFHFHDWCGELIKTYNVNLVGDSSEPYWERQVESVIQAVDRQQIPRAQYGAILIDEGHDFEEAWLKLIPQMIDPEMNSLLLLYDDAQSIYKRGGLGFTLSSVGIQAQGRTSILKLNYRNTREILSFSYQFAQHYISPHSSDEDHIPLIEPTCAGVSGASPELRLFKSVPEEVAFIARCVQKWHKAGTPLSDIAIIYSRKTVGREVQKQLNAMGIANLWMADKRTKLAYDPACERVTILTTYSSKGLEFPMVILAGMPNIVNDEPVETQARLVYVGLTRAQRNLLVTSCQPEHIFTQRLLEVNESLKNGMY